MEMGPFAPLIPLLEGPGGYREVREKWLLIQIGTLAVGHCREREFWREEKLLSSVGAPRSRAREWDSPASSVLSESSQEKESEGIRIGWSWKEVKKVRERSRLSLSLRKLWSRNCPTWTPAHPWLPAASPTQGWVPATSSQGGAPQKRIIPP